QLLTDVDRFAGTESALRHDLGQRAALDEVHPESDTPVVVVGAVHGDDVRMANAGQPARLVEDLVGQIRLGFRLEQLERNRVIEPGVVRVKHLAKCAFTDLPYQHEVAPAPERFGTGY